MLDEQFVPCIDNIRHGYKTGAFSPAELIDFLVHRAETYSDKNIWIERISPQLLTSLLDQLKQSDMDLLPLFGVPFAVKDNIDVKGFSTTAGCPAYAFKPETNAFLVQRLIDAGAIPLGKTNLDQFATGLVGTRSPHGACKNAFNSDYISGGSSSGSAVSVALGLVSFSIGTDTAGSGRVPAMLNNIIGLKPSRGLFSMSGVVPACRSLDCPSVFSLNTDDAAAVFDVLSAFDPQDAYSRANPFINSARGFPDDPGPPRIGVPQSHQLNFFESTEAEKLFQDALNKWRDRGAIIVESDFAPLLSAAKLLYEGPWVAERYAAIESLLLKSPEQIHPVVREIIKGAEGKSAVDAFKAEYTMQSYRAYAQGLFTELDILVTPTAPRHYLISELELDPIRLNANTGYYTNFMNLLDLCGIAVPSGFFTNDLPFGITLIAPRFNDVRLLNYARQWEQYVQLPVGIYGNKTNKAAAHASSVSFSPRVDIAVCGAHLQDLPLNWQLIERGARLRERTCTSANYRLYKLAGAAPLRPGMVRDEQDGVAIEVEVWSVPTNEIGSFIDNIPFPLGLGKIELEDSRWITGFICESSAISNADEITEFGSWRAFLAAQP